MSRRSAEAAFAEAAERYAEFGVDVERAMSFIDSLALSIHCWQGDDVSGFERPGGLSGGGIQVTGNQAGRARNPEELRADIEKVLSLVPGAKRLSLHAIYGDFGGKFVDRDRLEPEHFSAWMDWAREKKICLDFNATLFSHPSAADGFTLSHRDAGIRAFWIEHVKRARRVGAAMGRAQGSACVHNTWIPDGSKDLPVDRAGFRARLLASLDEIFSETYPPDLLEDAIEGKLFGIGSESFVVGSHEFYLGYAATRKKYITLDTGHYHPTESVADKISAVLPFVLGVLLHVSRGVRWDSDHVVILTDEIIELAREILRSPDLGRIRIGLDYFDASINRVGAWALGARSTRKALLMAALEARSELLEADEEGRGFARLALLEQTKSMPWNAVWDEYCRRSDIPLDTSFINEVESYERDVLAQRK